MADTDLLGITKVNAGASGPGSLAAPLANAFDALDAGLEAALRAMCDSDGNGVLSGWTIAAGAGLDVDIAAGKGVIDWSFCVSDAQNLATLPANEATIYIYLTRSGRPNPDKLCVASASISGAIPADAILIATCVTDASNVTSVDNAPGDRPPSMLAGGAVTDHALLSNLDYASAAHTGFQAALGFTAEDVANKSTDVTLGVSNTLYPSQAAVKAYVDAHSAGAHNLLSATHLDVTPASAVRGDLLIAQGASPVWARQAISVPAANVLNVLGVANGDAEPGYKTVLDATNPTTIGVSDAAAPGTSLIFAHRDHQHASPATWPASNALLLDQTTAQTVSGGRPTFEDGLIGNLYGLASSYTSEYPTAQNDTYVKATSKFSTDYWPYYATDPTKSLTGTWTGNQWVSANGSLTNQRFHIDLGSAKRIVRIYYENGHNSGTGTDRGVQNFTFWGSNDASAFAELTYGTDTGWTQLTCSQATLDEHTASDVADPKYIGVTNGTDYRYYALKCADNWGGTAIMMIRRVVLQSNVPVLSVDAWNRKLYLSDGTTAILDWTGEVYDDVTIYGTITKATAPGTDMQQRLIRLDQYTTWDSVGDENICAQFGAWVTGAGRALATIGSYHAGISTSSVKALLLIGAEGWAGIQAAGSDVDATEAYSFYGKVGNTGTGTLDRGGTVRVNDPLTDGDITLLIGIDYDVLTKGDTNYANYFRGTAIDYLGGDRSLKFGDAYTWNILNSSGTNLFKITADPYVGINLGAVTPTAFLDVQGGMQITHAANDNNSWAFNLRKSRGSLASPSATQSADPLGSIAFKGYGTSWVTGAQILPLANQNHSATAAGTTLAIKCCANDSITLSTVIAMGDGAKIGFLGAAAVARQAHIADADGSLADITTKFNTLLGYVETYGLLATS